ncbi:cation-translocating P-type ATPase [Qipengyuania zhejiangensis]|uniref:cation-translocating P-type ATPase n=1 Tax=Qipengyuania zhejiangensis TaxID=3077782 RepID=UPI002D783FE5|nr:HAD-IC family P-type ATPase [Qipengyuania sp. Z2]
MKPAPAGRAWHPVTGQEALSLLDSTTQGLDNQEAWRRLAQWGPNALPQARGSNVARVFIRQFASPLIYLLLFAGVLSLLIGDRWDAVFIFGVLLTNATISTFQEAKADASAQALRSLIPQTARLRRDGEGRIVPSDQIVPGDIVELESGMRITADLRLLEAQGLQIDEAPLTGESLPVTKDPQATLSEQTPVGDRTNMAFAGTTVAAGRGLGVAVETGTHTNLGQIGRTLEEATRLGIDTPMVRRLGHLSQQIALGSGALIAVLSAVLLLQGNGAKDIVLLAIALAVAAVPEGLPVAVTVALSASSRRMARRNVIVRELPAVEGLGACTLIASDKTGTLTANRLAVERIVLPDGSAIDRKDWRGADKSGCIAEIGRAAALCNEAHLVDVGSPVGDAVDVALLKFADESGADFSRMDAAGRHPLIPYEPELRFAAVEAPFGGRTAIIVKGAPETVIPMCRGNADNLSALSDALAAGGFRVLLLAQGERAGHAPVEAEQLEGLSPLAFLGLIDPLRTGVVEAVERCRKAGIDVRMITGDHPATAIAIARKIGMPVGTDSVATGAELAALETSRNAFERKVENAAVFARIEPSQKLAIVKSLSAQDHIVAVTGDGVNDGPALKAADIGVAMGIRGTDVARGASDLILADDNFATIVSGIEEGRVTFANIRKIVLFMVATGVAEIAMFIGALMAGLPMPLTPVQLLWLNLVTNGIQDVTLGFGRGEGDELQRPARRRLAPLIDRAALLLMAPGAIVMTVLAVLLLDRELAAGASLADARNAVLLMVVLFQNAFLLAIRHLRHPFWHWHSKENHWLFVGMTSALALHLAAMHLPFTQRLLGLAPPVADLLVLCASAAALVLATTEGAKILVRKLDW